jgi:hypothetical protein
MHCTEPVILITKDVKGDDVLGKSNKVNSWGMVTGGGIIVAAVGLIGYLKRKQKQGKAVEVQKEEHFEDTEKLAAFDMKLDEFFTNNLNTNIIFNEFKMERLLLTRDEKFDLIESLKMDYEKEFKREFNLTKALLHYNGNLKGEKEAENIKSFLENAVNNPYREKLLEKLKKYNIDINGIVNSILYANTNQIKEISADILKDFNMLKVGIEGEDRVIKELEKFSEEYKMFSNIRMKVNNDEIEFDNLVITDKGIVIIEVKNIGENGNSRLVITKDGQYKKIKNGHEQVITGYTPTSQLYHHALKLSNMLKKGLKERNYKYISLNIKPIVVIANDNIKIENESETIIVRVSEIFYHIFENNKKSFLSTIFNRNVELSSDLQNEIYNIISENAVKDKRYESNMPKDVIDTLKSNLVAINFVKDVNRLIEAYRLPI